MAVPNNIPFSQVIQALLDVDNPFPPRYLYQLSDLDKEEMSQLKAVWGQIPAWRRKALLEDAETLGEGDYLLSFEALARFAILDEDPAVRLPAVRTLLEYEEPKLIGPLMDLLRNDPDVEVQAAAAQCLGKYVYMGELEEIPVEKQRQVEDLLLEVLRSSSPDRLRRRALESVSFSSREEIPPQIEAAYHSGERGWLASALFSMGRSANERWQPLVMKELENLSTEVRTEAARAAGELEIHATLPVLLNLLNDPDENVRGAAIWSLSQIGGEGVRDSLEELLEETEDEEEVEFIESALDNLSFTEDIQLYDLIDYETEAEALEGDLNEDGLDDEGLEGLEEGFDTEDIEPDEDRVD